MVEDAVLADELAGHAELMDNMSGIPTLGQPGKRANTQGICAATTNLRDPIDTGQLCVVLTGDLEVDDD